MAGLDFPDDSRAVALVDYDGDGDLDLWVSNRTAPRLRLLRNNSRAAGNSVRLSLEGRQANRDAIGAQVRLYLEGNDDSVLSKTVRAGEGYLAQSSKILHFGLPERSVVDRVEVWWPGHEKETFNGVTGSGHYRLVEGAGAAERNISKVITELPGIGVRSVEKTDFARIVPHAPLWTPPLSYVNSAGESKDLRSDSPFTLVMLWATYCTPCLQEMKAFEQQGEALTQRGISPLLLNVEGLEESGEKRQARVKKFLQRNRISLASGLATTEVVESLDALQRVIIGRQIAIPVPCSFLLDAQGRVTVVYKGRVEVAQLLQDVDQSGLLALAQRDRAVPFAGRWYVNPLLPDQLAYPEKLLKLGRADTALRYLQEHYSVPGSSSAGRPTVAHRPDETGRLAQLYQQTGMKLLEKKESTMAVEALRSSLVLEPDSIALKANLGLILQQQGDLAGAVDLFRQVAEKQPNHLPAINSLAWILATSADPSVRNADEAIRWARSACQQTGYQAPETLNTLAAAYAAGGKFEKAVAAADEALRRLKAQGRTQAAQQLEDRQTSYRARKALMLP